jgi:iron(III) transport system substrate-binding protein
MMFDNLDRRRVLAGGLAFTAFGSVVGSGRVSAQALPALVEAARNEGGGMLYAISEPLINAQLAKAFKNKYGLTVDTQRLSSAPLAQRFISEVNADAVAVDVMISADGDFMHDGKVKGWFAAIGDLPAMRGLNAEAWDGTLAAVQFNVRSIIWNSDAIKELPPSWEVLVDPKWAGRVGYFDPRNSFPNVQWLSMLRKTYGDDFLRKLGKQATVIATTVVGVQQIAAGALAIYAPAAHSVIKPLQAKGAPIGEVIPQPYSGNAIYAAVPAKAPHPNTARLLLDFLMSPEGQAIFNPDSVSFVPNVPGTRPVPEPRWPNMPTEQAKKEEPELLGLLGL